MSNSFCDVDIVCKDRSRVSCHKIVLASLSSMLKVSLLSSGNNECAEIYLPEHDYSQVKPAVDQIYKTLAQTEGREAEIQAESNDLLHCLHIDILHDSSWNWFDNRWAES